jgi:DNA-binding SARP family transcriptional activator
MYFLRLFGGASLEDSTGAAPGIIHQRSFAVLALLAVARDKACSREKLIGYLWAESDQERARHRLSDTVYLLRKTLGDGAVLAASDVLRLNPEVVESDAGAFLDAIDSSDLEAAARLYEGPFLDGFYTSGAPEFERWVESERQRFADAYANALEQLAERAETAGAHRPAVAWWKRLVAHDPYNSRYILRLMDVMARSGDPANAIQVAQGHARLLKEELDAEPVPEVLEFAERLRREAGDFADAVERTAPRRTTAAAVSAAEYQIHPRRAGLLRPLAIYAAFSFVVVVTAHVFTLQFGLPNWLFSASVALLFACLPFVVLTAFVQGAPSARDWLNWRVSVALIATAFAVLGLAVSGYMVTRAMGIGPWATLIGRGVLEERDLIVLAEIEDHTGDSTLALTVTEAFRVDLGQSPVVRVAERDFVRQVLQRMEKDPGAPLTYDLAREVATREGLKALVAGEINRAGSGYVLSVRLVAAETGEELHAFRETAHDPDAIIPAIDRLSKQLRERIGESLRTIRDSPPLYRWRTASLEALRLYVEAADANDYDMDPERGLHLVNRALEIDTAFAGAYSLRALLLNNLGIQRAQAIADAARAYELRQRLPLRERYINEYRYHSVVTGSVEGRVNSLRALLDLEPEEFTWWYLLGFNYRRMGEPARAEKAFRRAIELDSLSPLSWQNLARVQYSQGKLDEAKETLRRFEFKVPEAPGIPLARAWLAFNRGDYDAAEASLKDYGDRRWGSLLYRGHTSRYLAHLAQVQGKLVEAESHFREAMAAFEEGDLPVVYLARGVELGCLQAWFLGDTARALETMAAALERHPLDSLEPVERPYRALAEFYAFAGAPERARATLGEWETVLRDLGPTPQEETRRRIAWGVVALAEGRAEEALAEFRSVQERSNTPIRQIPLLGRAYQLTGQPDSALAMYERFLAAPWYDRFLYLDTPAHGRDHYWLPVAYERLGDLYEQRGDTARAIHYYGKLVDLWKDADPELQPRVEAARRAIEALSPDA